MLGFLRIRQGFQRFFGITFISLLLFWASCTTTFKGISLNVIQLDWLAVCSSKGVG